MSAVSDGRGDVGHAGVEANGHQGIRDRAVEGRGPARDHGERQSLGAADVALLVGQCENRCYECPRRPGKAATYSPDALIQYPSRWANTTTTKVRDQNCEMNFQAMGGMKAFEPSSPTWVPSSTLDGVCGPSNVHTLTG